MFLPKRRNAEVSHLSVAWREISEVQRFGLLETMRKADVQNQASPFAPVEPPGLV